MVFAGAGSFKRQNVRKEKKMSSTKSTKTRLLDKRAVGSFYSNLSEAKSDSQEIKSLANFLNGAMKNWRGMILRAVLH